jgi:predicted glycogen debranching enzyme
MTRALAADAVEIIGWRRGDPAEAMLTREWIVTNGLGGYSTGTLAGIVTRRYHGLLVAALPAPHGRCVMLNHLEERLIVDGEVLHLSGDEPVSGATRLPHPGFLETFQLELGLPVWAFSNDSVRITKRTFMLHLQNTTCITYHLERGSRPVQLVLTPSLHFRPHEADVSEELRDRYEMRVAGGRIEVAARDFPSLKLMVHGQSIHVDENARLTPDVLYRTERSRGYLHAGGLWTPGSLSFDLLPGMPVTFIASTESWDYVTALAPGEALDSERDRRAQLLSQAGIDSATQPLEASLALAADQFIITPATRPADVVRARAAGHDAPRTIIAGYHWFTDWGRDTMISLEGLTLTTGRRREAASILRMFAQHVRDGLIPNMFPEGENEGLYHTADATMWFFHAVARYVETTGDRELLRQLLPALNEIIEHHIRGTRFGIGVDPADGLLRQGAEGYQLTWMDAKVDGWVVTPRRGKAVEINALFYNALRLLEGWTREEGDGSRASALEDRAAKFYDSFNARFWFEEGGYLFDVIDTESGGSDPALRPNQIFAVSLRHPVLARERWERVIEVVRDELLTPVGLRSLSRRDADYKARYDGDLRARDAAYHQGTVWSWLIGPFIDAWMKVYPDRSRDARSMLAGLEAHLGEAGIGTVSEIFDADEPYVPRGCIAQAWGVAEFLRCLRKLDRSGTIPR